MVGSAIGAMLQAQHSQQHPTAAPNSQVGRRGFYSDWAIAALMGYDQFYTDSLIPSIWVKFQMSKEFADISQELLTWMIYWAKTDEFEIDIDVFFVNLEIEEMIKTKFNPGGPVAMYEST